MSSPTPPRQPLTADEINAGRKAAAAPTPIPATTAPGTQAAPESKDNSDDAVQHGVGPKPEESPGSSHSG